ncbi:MAG: NAD(P)/FAD-dependent oxidoreductase [Robiginitalea sp.]
MPYLHTVERRDVIIIGAGLAGLTAAVELSNAGLDVLVFDKNTLPRHKVCGEYLSMEVVPYLASLGINLQDAPQISRFELSGSEGRRVVSRLPLGGVGISRHALDYRLYQEAINAGVDFIWQPVDSVQLSNGSFEVTSRGSGFIARQVLGAWGKRSNLDRYLKRPFFSRTSPWMGIKMHYRARYPSDKVGLYCFKGGYGGLSVTETGSVNFCYLIHKERFRETPNLDSCTRRLLQEHPSLGEILESATPLFKAALGISNIAFGRKDLVSNHILLSGDAAQLIHPLCGNGMAMAIETGRIQSHFAAGFLQGSVKDRTIMERQYRQAWNKKFATRLRSGAILQRLLLNPTGLSLGLKVAGAAPYLLDRVIQKTHGTP